MCRFKFPVSSISIIEYILLYIKVYRIMRPIQGLLKANDLDYNLVFKK